MKVLITGASHGFGEYIAKEFAKAGFDVWLHGRNSFNLLSVKMFLEDKYKINCFIICGDLNQIKTIDEIRNQILDNEIDVVVNNAFDIDFPIDSFMFQKNIIDAAIIILMPIIIININSVAGLMPDKLKPEYAAAKHGLKGYSDSLKGTHQGVNIIDLYIGAMSTGISEGRDDFDRLIDPQEVASLIPVLCKLDSCYVDLMVIKRP